MFARSVVRASRDHEFGVRVRVVRVTRNNGRFVGARLRGRAARAVRTLRGRRQEQRRIRLRPPAGDHRPVSGEEIESGAGFGGGPFRRRHQHHVVRIFENQHRRAAPKSGHPQHQRAPLVLRQPDIGDSAAEHPQTEHQR